MTEYMFIITIMLISFVFFCYMFRNKDGLPTNWPVVGMLPALLINLHRFNDFCIELMEKSNMTFHLKGPWFANMHLVFIGDPANIHHVLCKNFKDYVKGSKLKETLEPLGDGILISDSPLWNYHRKVAQSFFSHPQFHHSLVNITWKKIEIGLIPVLDHFSDRGVEIDLKDVFSRFMYDTMSILMMDHDPLSLSFDLHDFPLIKVVNDLERAAVSRHVVPTCVWKLQRWLNVGEEKLVKKSVNILDNFIYNCINIKKEQMSKSCDSTLQSNNLYDQGSVDLLTLFMNEDGNTKAPISHTDKFLRDTIANFFLAGVETTSAALCWFFYLLSKNPLVFHNIKEELDALMINMNNNDDKFLGNFSTLVYLHAALCESLRLYPSLPFDPKIPSKPDILPSGHKVNPSTQIIFCLYAMGRTKSIWGFDCNEFKPERWISEDGMLKHEPSNKFSVFGSGPRACIGKHMAFTQMKMVAAFIIQNYHIEAIGKKQVPDVSMVLHMKHEFKVRVFRSH